MHTTTEDLWLSYLDELSENDYFIADDFITDEFYDQITGSFCYLLYCQNSRYCAIIDPIATINDQSPALTFAQTDTVIDKIKELDLKLIWILETHIHADHVTAASKLKDITQCSTIMGEHTPAETVEIKVKDDEYINLDNLKIRAMYTPGHTSDSYSFLLDNYLFSGDTLLINGTGRTDFQNGNAKDSYNSIFNKLLKLPEETLLYPAHDYKGERVSTIGKEKKHNPRLQVDSVDQYVEIMNNLNLKKPVSIDFNISSNLKLGAL